MSISLVSTGTCVPERIVTNNELSETVDTNDAWIVERTGISERRVITHETAISLAVGAGADAIEKAGISAEAVDLIIVATFSGETLVPNTMSYVKSKLGAKNAIGFDLNAACSGFIFALVTAYQMIMSGCHETALVIGVERLSGYTDWKDRNTCVLFGDGAGAAILSKNGSGEVHGWTLRNILDAEGDLKLPSSTQPYGCTDDTIPRNVVSMQGKAVYKFATAAMSDCISEALEKSGLTADDIKLFIPHQANIRIIKYAANKLHLDISRFYINIERFGNTSSASVIIALDEAIKTGALVKGDKVMLVTFGGGYTAASIILTI